MELHLKINKKINIFVNGVKTIILGGKLGEKLWFGVVDGYFVTKVRASLDRVNSLVQCFPDIIAIIYQ